jgi:hypothetical protein
MLAFPSAARKSLISAADASLAYAQPSWRSVSCEITVTFSLHLRNLLILAQQYVLYMVRHN